MTNHPSLQNSLRQLLDAAVDAMFVIEEGRGVVALNGEAERLFGFTEAELLGQSLDQVIAPRFQHLVGSGSPPKAAGVDLFARRRDGLEFPVEFHRRPIGQGEDAAVLVTIRDLTRWRRAQETLFQEKEQAFVTLTSIADAVITTDLEGTITYLNPTAERLTGWRMTEALGQPLSVVLTLVSEATRQPIPDIAAHCLREGRAVDLVEGVLMLRRDGTEVTIGDSAAPLRDRNGATIGVVLVFHDITEKRRVVQRLSHEATHDPLTGLIGRQEFERRLVRVLSEAADGGAENAMCYLDLDRFKVVNDTCGHEAGDGLLRRVSRLLDGRLRSRDTIARLGGDEFGILLEHCSPAKAQEIAHDLVEAIEDFEFVWGDRRFSLGASIGVVPITAATERSADVMRAADHACYAAKEAGGCRVHVGPEAAPGPRQELENRRLKRLTRAVEEERFQLFTQAIVPLTRPFPARPRCEILLRLPDERGGVETPDSFLPHAERYHLTPAIDRWVIGQTIAILAAWHRDHADCELPICSINLSTSSLNDPDLVPTLREHLGRHELPPEALCFEIDEAAALGRLAHLARLVSEIREVGCSVGLENFGSGLDSFAHLKARLVDYVKIGGHYVRGVAEDPMYDTLVRTVNEISQIMGLTTIADEVESELALEKLRALGVAFAQGDAVAPTVPLTDPEGEVALPCVLKAV